MKKETPVNHKNTVFAVAASLFFSSSAMADLRPSESCAQLRQTIEPEENFPGKYENPFSIAGCDLDFDFPGFSFDMGVNGFDFCSIVQNVTRDARQKVSEAADRVEDWTRNEVNVDAEEGATVNGERVVDGVDPSDALR